MFSVALLQNFRLIQLFKQSGHILHATGNASKSSLWSTMLCCCPNNLVLLFECAMLGERERSKCRTDQKQRVHQTAFTCEHKPTLPRHPTKQLNENLTPQVMLWNKQIFNNLLYIALVYLQARSGKNDTTEWQPFSFVLLIIE